MSLLGFLWGLLRALFTSGAQEEGRAEQRDASYREAERQEAEDDKAGRTAADGPDDPRDVLPER